MIPHWGAGRQGASLAFGINGLACGKPLVGRWTSVSAWEPYGSSADSKGFAGAAVLGFGDFARGVRVSPLNITLNIGYIEAETETHF